MNKKNNKGFTLAEMLIVVAIIGVLVAIMIPTLTSQLEKAKESADAANIRSAISELQVNYLQNGENDTRTVGITQTKPWEYVDAISGESTSTTGALGIVTKAETLKITISGGAISFSK